MVGLTESGSEDYKPDFMWMEKYQRCGKDGHKCKPLLLRFLPPSHNIRRHFVELPSCLYIPATVVIHFYLCQLTSSHCIPMSPTTFPSTSATKNVSPASIPLLKYLVMGRDRFTNVLNFRIPRMKIRAAKATSGVR